MIWLLLLAAVLALAAAPRALRPVLKWIAREPAPSAAIPRDPVIVERVIGAAMFGGALYAIAPMLLDPHDHGPLGSLVTPVVIGIGMLVAALVADGPRGRARFATVFFDSNRQYIAARTYIFTDKKTRRLEELGSAPVMCALLALGSLVLFAKPVITPHQEGRSTYDVAPVSAPLGLEISPAERAELEAAAAGGSASARGVLAMLQTAESAPQTPSPAFALDGYTAERNVMWPSTGAALLLLTLALVLSRGGLSRGTRAPSDLSAAPTALGARS